jgi:pentatricopeptide repeat protein
MEGLWRDSTNRFLDLKETPVGSLDFLQWHLVETMIVYWSKQHQQGRESLDISLKILDRLAEETAVTCAHTTNTGSRSRSMIDVYLVHSILKSWNECFRKNTVHILPSEILKRIEDCFEKSNQRLFQPNIATYTIILDGATHCPHPKERLVFTENLLTRLLVESENNPFIRPTTVTFGTVIHALAKSKSRPMAEKAEGWLRRLHSLHEAGWPDVQPNTVVYTSVISAWANVGEVGRAEALLQEMYQESFLHDNKEIQPNLRTFNTLLTAWSKSTASHSIESAESLLRKMIELANGTEGFIDSPPDIVSFNCMLSTIARHRMKKDSLAKAEFWMEELLKRPNVQDKMETPGIKGSNMILQPNRITYTALFKIIAASNVANKAERARFWLERSTNPDLLGDPFLLQRIQVMEEERSSMLL